MAGILNDGTNQGGGQVETPNSTSSPTPQSKPFDGNVSELISTFQKSFEERFTQVEKNLSDKLGRVQGEVTRSGNDFRTWLGKVEQLEKKGLTRDEAVAELENRDSESQWKTNLEKQVANIASLLQSGGTQSTKGQVTAQVFEKIGLDLNNPLVADALTKQYENAEQVELAGYRIKEALAKQPNPTSAQQPSLQSGNATQVDMNAISAEYDQLAKNPTAPGAMKRMSEIQEELRKL